MLESNQYTPNHLVLILGDYNVDALGKPHPINYLDHY
jgi:hypothetical protein